MERMVLIEGQNQSGADGCIAVVQQADRIT
jgi:hypothetical protein